MRITIRQLRKEYRTKAESVLALDDVDMDVSDGECVAILGPSGSGKTTLLRCVAGLERPDSGYIEINGQPVYSSAESIFVPPEQRGVSMVFQSYALWPHMTVAENVAYPLRAMGKRRPKDVKALVQTALDRVGCGAYLARYPAQLSGGQQQRVAVARAIVANTDVIIFDEALSSVDMRVRETLRLDLLNLKRQLGFASIYVTHDQTEATVLGDSVAVMNKGAIVQQGTPREVYDSPATPFVSKFVGSCNWLNGQFNGRDGFATKIGAIRSADTMMADRVDPLLVFRPEHVQMALAASGTETVNCWRGRIDNVLFLGPHLEYVVSLGTEKIIVKGAQSGIYAEGDEVYLSIKPEHVRVLDAADV